MNFTQSFEEFSSSVGPTGLMLYAGIALIVWVLFKDKLTPLQGLIKLSIESVKRLLSASNKSASLSSLTVPAAVNKAPAVLANSIAENTELEPKSEDLFFKLIVSWKETRDLAVRCGCDKAVEVADTMFPYLSPNVCGKDAENE